MAITARRRRHADPVSVPRAARVLRHRPRRRTGKLPVSRGARRRGMRATSLQQPRRVRRRRSSSEAGEMHRRRRGLGMWCSCVFLYALVWTWTYRWVLCVGRLHTCIVLLVGPGMWYSCVLLCFRLVAPMAGKYIKVYGAWVYRWVWCVGGYIHVLFRRSRLAGMLFFCLHQAIACGGLYFVLPSTERESAKTLAVTN